MNQRIESLVNDYDRGALDRRGFVLALTALLGAREARAETPFTANSLNHVTLAVKDPESSGAFYERVLGVEVVSRQSNGINLGLGESFLGVYEIYFSDPDGIRVQLSEKDYRG